MSLFGLACGLSMSHESVPTQPLDFQRFTEAEMQARAIEFRQHLSRRRSVRDFSDESIPLDVVRECIRTAGTAPSGANKQPWTFCLVTNPAIKRSIREAAEAEERENYRGRMSQQWLDDLHHLGTDDVKPHIEDAPALIIVFRKPYEPAKSGKKQPNYYVSESVGIAVGMLISALHQAGFATLPHTPSPMDFLAQILNRPREERAYLLLPVGYPAKDTQVPVISRKKWQELCVEYG